MACMIVKSSVIHRFQTRALLNDNFMMKDVFWMSYRRWQKRIKNPSFTHRLDGIETETTEIHHIDIESFFYSVRVHWLEYWIHWVDIVKLLTGAWPETLVSHRQLFIILRLWKWNSSLSHPCLWLVSWMNCEIHLVSHRCFWIF